jgi:class 3 adenylate cyclase
MGLRQDIGRDVTVPEAEDVELGNDAVCLNGTVLYADMSDSTGLVDGYKDWFAAEIYKTYLISACRIIRANGGEITAFDGDRVMAVFIGDSKNTSAARTALTINYVVSEVINSAIKAQYPNESFKINQVVGIDTSPLFIVRTGIRGSNDLVWVGRAANYAAKLSNLSLPGYSTLITQAVFDALTDSTKYGGQPRMIMWEKDTWARGSMTIYKSSW